jgi:predicted alternative tryptophan synthase beta-subunit
MKMEKTFELDQMQLFCDISKAIAKQNKKIPADNRSNAAIKAANMIVMAYSMTNEEFVSQFGSAGHGLVNK